MERMLMQEMLIWKDSAERMPLLIEGARQVGKTWIMKEFGRRHFKNCAYINFENNPVMERVMERVFETYSDTAQLAKAIAAYARQEIVAGKTLPIQRTERQWEGQGFQGRVAMAH
jgi:predicted AAA+ superfamily ATPase